MSHTTGNTAKIKIFVSTHKKAQFADGANILPIQVGAANSDMLFENTLHDNTSDNISKQNPMYNELTAQYWAWKNVDADYYGFCHYRRYFNFSQIRYEENDYGEIIDDFIDARSIEKYGLDDQHINQTILGWDVLTSPLNDVRKMGGFKNLKEHWESDKHLQIKDLRCMYDILCSRHPDYRQAADTVLNGSKAAFCNMFIMRKPIFEEYNDWLFPLLQEFVDVSDFNHADQQTLRTVGHLSERLLNIFILHHQRNGSNWHIKQLQCVHFMHPEQPQLLEPLDKNPRFTVPVVFAADNSYVPMLTTTIYSLLKHADTTRHYDIIIMQRDISKENQQEMVDFFKIFEDATIRFYSVNEAISSYVLTTNNPHISVETYYRFIIQDALPFYSKILYLDSDLIITDDISKLYDSDLYGNALGAVTDIDFLGNLNMKNNDRKQYSKHILQLNEPYKYFQAGVLIMNLDKLRQIHSVTEWLNIAADPKYIYNDQDILNKECQGSVTFLDNTWNVMHDCADRVQGVFSFAPTSIFLSYLKSREAPRIVHYAGFDKPWKNPWCDFGPLYWRYAKDTPFSLQIISYLTGVQPPKKQTHHERAISESSPVRKYVDALAPSGTKRRELLKITVRKLQKKQ